MKNKFYTFPFLALFLLFIPNSAVSKTNNFLKQSSPNYIYCYFQVNDSDYFDSFEVFFRNHKTTNEVRVYRLVSGRGRLNDNNELIDIVPTSYNVQEIKKLDVLMKKTEYEIKFTNKLNYKVPGTEIKLDISYTSNSTISINNSNTKLNMKINDLDKNIDSSLCVSFLHESFLSKISIKL